MRAGCGVAINDKANLCFAQHSVKYKRTAPHHLVSGMVLISESACCVARAHDLWIAHGSDISLELVLLCAARLCNSARAVLTTQHHSQYQDDAGMGGTEKLQLLSVQLTPGIMKLSLVASILKE